MEIQKNFGFTILELVIIIVILGVVAVITSIKLPGTSVNVVAQATQLANDIRYTQNLSMARNQHYRLVITSSSSYAVRDGSGNTDYNINLGSGIILSPSGYTIIFNSKGVPYSDDSTPLASTATISVISSEQTSVVSITPKTGRVTTS
ncbi:MAG: hypothetical protein ACD_21C00107G0015 [uncultured bacterium]|nr:MAG: hypothetical protein ACD_21C00107G0015 [uncultured bacterium]